MEPNAFIAEVYRRMTVRAEMRGAAQSALPPTERRIADVASEYRAILPRNKDAKILDIGYGNGWFMAACRQLGYTDICGAEFGGALKPYMREWGVRVYAIDTSIADLLQDHPSEFDYIHLSHVIEHIPKYSLLFSVDAIYQALREDGTLCLRTPNMEGPAPNSAYYVTLAHEYGFAGSNLKSLLDICGFDDIKFLTPFQRSGLKQRIGRVIRWPFLQENRIRHRLFGVNAGDQFGTELIVTASRRTCTPFFDERFR